MASPTANTFEALAGIPEALAVSFGSDLEPIYIANARKTSLRTEWRKNANTGKLRGVAFRERNKERKAVRYVGERSVGSRKAEYDRYSRAYTERNDEGRSVGSRLDGSGSVGSDETGQLIPLPQDWPRNNRIAGDGL